MKLVSGRRTAVPSRDRGARARRRALLAFAALGAFAATVLLSGAVPGSAHPLLLGGPVPLNATALSGYYYNEQGHQYSHQCLLQVAADNPRKGDDRYTKFAGAFTCGQPTGKISVTHQARLYDWHDSSHLASGPLVTGDTTHFGYSEGFYTRGPGQTMHIRYDITLTLPNYPTSAWTNLPPGCSGVNTRTATCVVWSSPFQAFPFAGECDPSACPDRDSDGVYDDADACPDSPGDRSSQGCPGGSGSGSEIDPDGDYEEVGSAETAYEGTVAADEEVPDSDADTAHGSNYAVSCAGDDEYVEGLVPTYGEPGTRSTASATPEAALVSFAGSGGLMPALPTTLFAAAERAPDHVVYVARVGGHIRAVIVVERTGGAWLGVYYEGCSKFAQQVAGL